MMKEPIDIPWMKRWEEEPEPPDDDFLIMLAELENRWLIAINGKKYLEYKKEKATKEKKINDMNSRLEAIQEETSALQDRIEDKKDDSEEYVELEEQYENLDKSFRCTLRHRKPLEEITIGNDGGIGLDRACFRLEA